MKGFLWSLMLSLIIAACGHNTGVEPAPPTIHYGEDVCEFCGMIASEERYAAGYIVQDGHEHIFDDIGDMVQAHLQEQEDVMAFFVHHHERRAWIRAETAYYVLSSRLPTPMFSGLAALTSVEEAEALALELDGQILTFDELLTQYRGNPPKPVFVDRTSH